MSDVNDGEDLPKGLSRDPPRVSPDDAFKDVGSDAEESWRYQDKFENEFSKKSVIGETEWVKLNGLSDHFWHKKLWSWVLLGVIVWMVFFQSALLIGIGLGRFDFTSYSWLLPTVMIQYLAQIVGLAVFVVRHLFSRADP